MSPQSAASPPADRLVRLCVMLHGAAGVLAVFMVSWATTIARFQSPHPNGARVAELATTGGAILLMTLLAAAGATQAALMMGSGTSGSRLRPMVVWFGLAGLSGALMWRGGLLGWGQDIGLTWVASCYALAGLYTAATVRRTRVVAGAILLVLLSVAAALTWLLRDIGLARGMDVVHAGLVCGFAAWFAVAVRGWQQPGSRPSRWRFALVPGAVGLAALGLWSPLPRSTNQWQLATFTASCAGAVAVLVTWVVGHCARRPAAAASERLLLAAGHCSGSLLVLSFVVSNVLVFKQLGIADEAWAARNPEVAAFLIAAGATAWAVAAVLVWTSRYLRGPVECGLGRGWLVGRAAGRTSPSKAVLQDRTVHVR